MSADRSEPKPFLSWSSVWLVIEWWPVLGLALMAAGLGRWWNVPQWIWHHGKEVQAKTMSIAVVGGSIAIGMLIVGVYLLRRSNARSSAISQFVALRKLYAWSAVGSFLLALLTVIQLMIWYREHWTPIHSPRSPSMLDYRYFQCVDVRLQQVSHSIRDGNLVWPQNIPPLKASVGNATKSSVAISSKQLVNEIREYISDWGEAEYARADELEGRKASLGMLAMMIEPDPRQLELYMRWKEQEESRLRLFIQDATVQAEAARHEHEDLALQWTEEKVPEKKSVLANQVVAAEDRLNAQIREQTRLQGRLEVLANDRLVQQGLNRQYAWLNLPTVSRGGWLRILSTWLLAIYLSIRLVGTGVLSIVGYLKLLRGTAEVNGYWPNDFGGFVIAAGLWWLILGW